MIRKHFLMAAIAIVLVLVPAATLGAQRVVLAEEFTATGCGWCPSAMEGLHILQMLHPDRLAVIAYHIWSSDPFKITGCDARKNYYGVGGIPDVYFDGVVNHLGGGTSPVDYTPEWNQREGIPSPATLDLMLLAYDGATGQGTVRATIYNDSQNTIDCQLRFVATGDDTLYNWAGFDHLYFTALHIFPDAQGVTVSVDPSQFHVETHDFLIPEGWRDRACTIVGFLQDDTTKEVLQAGNLTQVTPVELVSFAGRSTRDGVLLTWATASEKENAGFRIHRIVNGREELLTLGMIPGSGTTAIPQQYEYVDSDVEPGTTYLYKLSDVSVSGIVRFHTPVSVTIPETWGVPTALHLEPIHPCPAKEGVSLTYSLPGGVDVAVSIFDLAGRRMRVLPTVSAEAGIHTTTWDLKDKNGSRVAPGLYLAKVRAGSEEVTGKIIVAQ